MKRGIRTLTFQSLGAIDAVAKCDVTRGYLESNGIETIRDFYRPWHSSVPTRFALDYSGRLAHCAHSNCLPSNNDFRWILFITEDPCGGRLMFGGATRMAGRLLV